MNKFILKYTKISKEMFDILKKKPKIDDRKLFDNSKISRVYEKPELIGIFKLSEDILKEMNSQANMAESKYSTKQEIIEYKLFTELNSKTSLMNLSMQKIRNCLGLDLDKNIEEEKKGIKEREECCLGATAFLLEGICILCDKIRNSFRCLLEDYDIQYVLSILINIGKLEMATQLLEAAMKSDPQTLFYLPQDHPLWNLINQHTMVDMSGSKNFEKGYRRMEKDMLVAFASLCEGFDTHQNEFLQMMKASASAIKFNVQKAGKLKAEYSLNCARTHPYTQVYNVLESNFMNNLRKITFPSIKINKKIYIPRLLEEMTFEELEELNLNSQKVKGEESKHAELKIVELDDMDSKFIINKKLFNSEMIKLRILSDHPLPKIVNNEGIIIHLHGGGFVAQSSRSHQNFSRKLALETHMMVISVDYGLAPKCPYPQSVEDVWAAYYWIVKYGEKELNISPEFILLAGDSAGGNLAVATTLRAIQMGFRKPDGLLLAYPALNLSLDTFSPSLLYALDDIFLRFSFLTICLQSYVQNAHPAIDPYLSPILISDSDLREFPPVRLMSAGRDPLRDEAYRFLSRLITNGIDAHLHEFRNLPHAFLYMYAPLQFKEYTAPIQKAVDWVGELSGMARMATQYKMGFKQRFDEIPII